MKFCCFSKIQTPIILVLISLGLIVPYTSPAYELGSEDQPDPVASMLRPSINSVKGNAGLIRDDPVMPLLRQSINPITGIPVEQPNQAVSKQQQTANQALILSINSSAATSEMLPTKAALLQPQIPLQANIQPTPQAMNYDVRVTTCSEKNIPSGHFPDLVAIDNENRSRQISQVAVMLNRANSGNPTIGETAVSLIPGRAYTFMMLGKVIGEINGGTAPIVLNWNP